MSTMNTNLLGRTIQANYDKSEAAGTIVAVYIDRGEMFLGVENPEGGLYNTSFVSVRLMPVSYTAAGTVIGTDLQPFQKEEAT